MATAAAWSRSAHEIQPLYRVPEMGAGVAPPMPLGTIDPS
jgi:hypothetical protein